MRELVSIEDYVKEIERLKVLRQKTEDDKDFVNAKLSTQREKHNAIVKALNDKTMRNDEICENKLSQIDRLIEEYKKTIELKANIAKEVADKITKKDAKIERKQCVIGRKGE